MRIIGLDLSSTQTGLVVRTADGYESYLIERDKASYTNLCIYMGITLEILRIMHSDDLVFMEDYGFAFKKSGIMNAELGGIVKFHINRVTHKDPYTVPPMTLKKYILGTGKGEKDQIMKAVFKNWGVDLATSHENEAYALSEIGCNLIGWTQPRTKAQTEVVEVVKQINKGIKL